jgi:hypothetical protein
MKITIGSNVGEIPVLQHIKKPVQIGLHLKSEFGENIFNLNLEEFYQLKECCDRLDVEILKRDTNINIFENKKENNLPIKYRGQVDLNGGTCDVIVETTETDVDKVSEIILKNINHAGSYVYNIQIL